jgi:predicted MFS family arabinose efflux permease
MTIYCTEKLHFTLPQAGVVMSLFGAGAIVGAFIGGKITDKFGFYRQQLVSLFLGGSMFIVTGFLQSFFSLCIGTFILSVCNESFRPANAAAVAYYSKEETRTRSYSLNRLAINLGWAVGGTLGGFLASMNYHLLFWVDGCTNIMAAILLFRLLPYAGSKASVVKVKTTSSQHAYKDKTYLAFIIITFFFAACFFQLFTMQPVFFQSDWHFNEAFIGFLMALNGIVITLVEMVLVYSIDGKKAHTFFIRTGFLICAVSFAVLNLMQAGRLTAILAIALMTFGEMFSMPFMSSYCIERSALHNRGQYTALYAMAWSLAQIVGPLSGSFIAASFGFSTLWWIVSLICILTSVSILVLEKRTKSTGKAAFA